MNAIGTITDTIEFTSNLSSPTKGSWNGIKVIGTTNPLGVGNQVTMKYCKGQYAQFFIDLDEAYHGPYIFQNCYFENNFQVNKDGGMPATIFENCSFVSNINALGTCQFDSRVSNSFFHKNVNGASGIGLVENCIFTENSGTALSPYGSTVGCTIKNNNIGVSCYFNSINNTFKNNTITDNIVGIEILSYFNNTINFTGNTFCNNSAFNVKLLTQNNADLSNNCWCSTDSTFIRATISDGYVNTANGLVNYLPLSNKCEMQSLGVKSQQASLLIESKIYPNPFKQSATLEFSNPKKENYALSIYTLQGKLLRTITNITTNSFTIERHDLPSGLLIFQIRTKSGIISTGKFLIE